MKELNLVCTQCKRQFPLNHEKARCVSCKEPLEVEKFSQGRIKEGETFSQTILERYADFFPFIEIDRSISLHEGFTPLVRSKRLASEIGLKRLFLKNETQNPTWSFKDRGTAVGLQHAATLGYKKIGTLSTGNMAVSVAAYGARAGFDTVILITTDLPSEKLGPIAIHGPTIIRVDGDYCELYSDSLKIGNQQHIYFISSDVPIRVEGTKTIALEICEQMSFEVPDYVVVPTSAGGNIRGVIKGYEEFKSSGMISNMPAIVCAQSSGCSPIYAAFNSGKETNIMIFHP